MSIKFQTPIDLGKNELQNAVIQNLASAPSSPVEGQVYYDTTNHIDYIRTNSTWVARNTGGGGGDFSSNTATSVDGEVVLFAGTAGKTGKRATGSGIAKLNSGVLGTATAGTDYVAATTGSSIQKANGAGGLTAATSGTDYAPATATTSSLKGNGSGGFAAATLNDNATPTADYSMGGFKLTSVGTPTTGTDAANKSYVDATAAGIDWKGSVRAATTAAGTLASSFANASTIDGVTLATGDRILIKNQSSASENGIYVVAASGAPTRATDADSNAEVTGGMAVFVEEGTTNADTGWVLTNNGAITLGTTGLTFTQFTGLGMVVAGTGLSQSGNTISLSTPVAAANGGAGTVSGILKANGSGTVSAAVSGTDYAPATSGSSILKGNGSGGTTTATAGTDYYNPGGTDVAVTDGGTGASTAAGAKTNLGFVTKYTGTIGDNTTTAIAVTHGLGSQYVTAQVFDATSNAMVMCDITLTSSTVTTFTFTTAPTTNQYRVVIIG